MNDNPKPGKNGFKFPQQRVKTRITEVKPNHLSTRGYNQEDLIENLSFAEMVFLLLIERLPDEREAKVFNHILVSFCDHGVTPPSTQSARLIASSGANINNAVAGGLLSFGKNHAGAIEKAMELFQESIESLNLEETDEDDVNRKIAGKAIEIVEKYESESKRIPGYGHRYHDKDPRAVKLLDLAIQESAIGPHTKLALAIENMLSERKGICLNVDGVNAGLLSDLDFDSSLGLGIFMIGRLPGLVAHAYEEMEEEEKFRRFCDLEDIVYEGFKNRNIEDNLENSD
ncbi:MAG: citryl-CoA lyase [Methanobrevibacter sp.]|nr:citryl-CoA lyase [Methanobrevibacter sp.]